MSLVDKLKEAKMKSWEFNYEDCSYLVVFLLTDINGKDAVCTLKLCTRGDRSLIVGLERCQFVFHPLPPFLEELLTLLEKRRREEEGFARLMKEIYS